MKVEFLDDMLSALVELPEARAIIQKLKNRKRLLLLKFSL